MVVDQGVSVSPSVDNMSVPQGKLSQNNLPSHLDYFNVLVCFESTHLCACLQTCTEQTSDLLLTP